MADNITLTYSATTFKEAAINNGAIANGITIKIANGTFAGDNGDSLLWLDEDGNVQNMEGVPAGLTPVLVKTSATTARLTFEGTATAHENANDITAADKKLVLWFDEFHFAKGTLENGVEGKFLAIDFNNKVTTGLTLVPTMAEGDVVAPDTTAFYTAGNTKTGAKDNLPTIGGVGTKGETLYFYSNGKILDKTISTKVGDTGEWTYDLSGLASKFKDGTHIVTVSNTADGKGVMSNPFAFTVDSKAPSAPSVTAVKGAISDVTPVLTGKAEKFATVKVYSSDDQVDPTLDKSGKVTNSDKVTLLGTTKADAKGLWTLAVDSSNTLLAKDGGYKISAKAIDAAGNATVSKTQTKDNLTIDTTIAESTVVIDTAKSKGNSVALSGKVEGETGGTVQLYGGADGSVALGKAAKIGKDGTWKISVKLNEGDHDLNVVATDAAGNVSYSQVVKKTIDTSTAVPTLELAETEGSAWSTMYGTAEAGAEVTVKNGSTEVGKATADRTGKWVLDNPTGALPTKDGTVKLTATAKDTAGNVSKASSPADEFKFTAKAEDKTAPTLLFAETTTDGTKVVLTYSQALATVTAEATAFDVTVGSASAAKATAVATSGAKVTLTLATAAKAGETVKVTYTAPAAETEVKADDKAIQDKAGNNAITLTDKAVTNLVPATEEQGGGGGAVTIDATAAADKKTLTEKTETFVTQFGSVAVDAVSSTVAFDASNSLAKTAETFSIKLAGVNGDNLITVAGFSPLASASALAVALQTALREADSDATDISVAWDASVLTITDAKGRAFSDASLKDGDQAELDDTITITNGSVGVVAADSFSNLAALDVLTGFAIGTDKVDLKTAAGAAADTPTALTRVTDVATSDDLSDALSTAFAGLDADVAGLVVINGGSAAGTYLYADNGNGTVDTTADVFIKLVGTTGDLGAIGPLTVGDFFA